MNIQTANTLGALLVALSIVGCSEKAPPGRLENAAVDSVPVTPNPQATAMTEAADQAIKKKSYMEAVTMVVQMGQTPGMTPEQLVKYKNLRRDLQIALSEAAAAGDSKAVEAIQMLRMSTSPVR